MAVMLTIALIRLLMGTPTSFGELFAFFFVGGGVGTGFGILIGGVMRWGVNAPGFRGGGIYLVLSVGLVVMTYVPATFLHGSGFLAVYLAGLTMRRKSFIHQQNVLRFHDGLAWLMQVTMFLMLGLQVFPARLLPVAGVGIMVSLFLIIVARPAAVHLSLAFSSMPFREQTLVAWAGLRGSVPIILATFPLLAGVKQADTIFHLVFFITLTSVFIQ